MMNRILIVGGTGYLGKYLAKASVSQGYPTFVLARPATAATHDSSKEKLLRELKDNGIHILAVRDSLLFSISSCNILMD
jgi:nucleoside-diphosphate-sugar epimerase